MAVTLANTFEGGTNTTTITQGVGGNSGGTSGNFFDVVTIGASATGTFSSTAPIRGTESGAFSTGASVVSASVTWSTSIGTAVSRAYCRICFKLASLSVTTPIFRVRGAAAQAYRVTVNTSGKIELRNAANTVVATSSTTTVATGTAYMLRLDLPIGASVSPVAYINTDLTSNTAFETLSPTGVNSGTNNIDEVTYGIVVSTASVSTVTIDDLVFTDQGLPGPPSQSVTPSDAFTSADSLARALALPRATADAYTSADSPARALALPRSVADGFTTSDTAARGLLLPRASGDAVTAADAPTRSLAIPRATADTVTAGDSPTSSVAVTANTADAYSATDAAARSVALGVATSDAVTFTDAVARVQALARGVADGWGTTAAAAASVVGTARNFAVTYGAPQAKWYYGPPYSARWTFSPARLG